MCVEDDTSIGVISFSAAVKITINLYPGQQISLSISSPSATSQGGTGQSKIWKLETERITRGIMQGAVVGTPHQCEINH
jgi:hypothetical protein